ncbi:hypothetical protein COT94_00595 [Candidatus Falkowbacteria bacterium CG10_big_fil_rev_8_21_14_0_10_37_14]|uniref:Type 4 fimbrial biogenesis protein PilX N-terminal domain-containing protein n=1 Tax=Candidatus Falkowbacteria bacterium CG10_big_fil_rev_8_21_14_0_10_37_14 TaxID=1974561 RepID=A0A2M6WUR3_9BACT|nr:hypothetical protein [Candidatus Falkowbacteria bacterium]PIT96446.1 MAG: hypothetical protein COT94_00595 [Candidatus Falkowbacteria bacterium CG10_big_fil_rev_8_21_14_0_10_37_14]
MRLSIRHGSALLTTLFLLFGMMAMAMIATDIITSGLQRQRAEGASLKAFYAAEAGVEWSALQFKLYGHGNSDKDLFTCRIPDTKYFLIPNLPPECKDANPAAGNEAASIVKLFGNDNLPKYSVKFFFPTSGVMTNQVTLNSRGSFQGTNRELEVFFCVPYCGTGDIADGCGRYCF